MADEYSGIGADKETAREALFKEAGEGAKLSGRVEYEVSLVDQMSNERVSGKKAERFERAYASAIRAVEADPDTLDEQKAQLQVKAYGTFEKAVVKAAEPATAGKPSGAERSTSKTSELTDMF